MTTGPRVSPQFTSASSGAFGEHGRRDRRSRGRAAARRRPAARRRRRRRPGPGGAPTSGGRRRSAARARSPESSPGPTFSARACAASASRNGSATARCTCTRSSEPHDWPAPANALAGDLGGRPFGVDAGVDDRQVAARGLLARAHHEVDAGVGGERARGALVAVEDLQDRAEVEQLDDALGGQRRLLRRLEDDRVAGDERRGERAARRRQRIGTTASGSRRRRAARAARGRRAAGGRARAGRAPRRPRATAIPASTPPSEPGSGVPASRVCSSASSRAHSRSRRAAAFSSEPRALGIGARPGAVRGARRARPRRAPPGAAPAGMCPIGSPVAGSSTASCGARCLTPRSSVLIVPCVPATRARPGSNTCGVAQEVASRGTQDRYSCDEDSAQETTCHDQRTHTGLRARCTDTRRAGADQAPRRPSRLAFATPPTLSSSPPTSRRRVTRCATWARSPSTCSPAVAGSRSAWTRSSPICSAAAPSTVQVAA